MRPALTLIFTPLSGCAEPSLDKAIDSEPKLDKGGSYWTEVRKAPYDQALDGARLSRERYIVTTRPALQLMFRQEYPTMTEADIEFLVNDALEKGLHQEAGRRREEPLMRPFNKIVWLTH